MAHSMTDVAAAKRAASRVQLVTTLVSSGTSPKSAMASAREFIPSPGLHTADMGSERPSARSTMSKELEVVCTSPLKSEQPAAASVTKTDYKATLLSEMDPASILNLSPYVMQSLKELAGHCVKVPAVRLKVDECAAELANANNDDSVLAALGRIKDMFK